MNSEYRVRSSINFSEVAADLSGHQILAFYGPALREESQIG